MSRLPMNEDTSNNEANALWLQGAGSAPNEAEDERQESEASSGELYPGDCGTLPLSLRVLLVTLLKGPYLYRDKRREMWKLMLANLDAIRPQLANLLLELVVDDETGVAYVRRPDLNGQEAPSLLNQYTFKFLDSVLLVEMRDRLMRAQNAGERAVLSIDEIRTHLSVFEPSAKTDTATFAGRLSGVLKRMRERHLLFDLGTSGESFEVSPVLKTVFDAAQMEALKNVYIEHIERVRQAASLAGEADDDDVENDDKENT